MQLRLSLLTCSLCLAAAISGPAADPANVPADEKTLQEAGIAADGPALLEFFRRQTLPDRDHERIQTLVKQMGDDSFHVREKAFANLVNLGPAASPLLRQARTHSDIEIVRRAERCLKLIEKSFGSHVCVAAARLLALRKPEGSAETLLAYVPYAEDEAVLDEVRVALTAIGFPGGKPGKPLVDALQDKLAGRRVLAAEVLARGGAAEGRTLARRLLQDADATVRLRTASALVEAKDKEAVPVLIALLTELPREQCWRVEDVLYWVSGEGAPNAPLGETDESRRKARDLWAGWWTKNGDKIDLVRLDEGRRFLGRLLLVEMVNGNNGRIREIGRDGKERWSITGDLTYPVDVQAVGSDRIVVAEYTARRVTERNLKGEILWTKQFAAASYPLSVQRLDNGNTVITTRNQIVEVDRKGTDVFTHQRASDIAAGGKTRDGQYVFVTRTGQCIRLDAAGKQVKAFQTGPLTTIGANIDVLPNGRVLVPLFSNGKVVEYDSDGKAVWETAFANPTSVARLPNGNTLIASSANMEIVEVDRAGKRIWQMRGEGRLMRVRPR